MLESRAPDRSFAHHPMAGSAQLTILSADDGPPVRVRAGSDDAFLILCDHASVAIPRALGTLGLSAGTLSTHIACDIGAGWVAERLAARLAATQVTAGYSRLVIDCNRYPWDPASIASASAGTAVPGNAALTQAERIARIAEIFLPYQRAVEAALDGLIARGASPVVLSIHSCTPQLGGEWRPWPVGLSYAPPADLSARCVAALRRASSPPIGNNQPYTLDLGIDYTVPEHALRRGLRYLQVEFRQDLVATPAAAHAWADRFEGALRAAVAGAAPQTAWSPAWPSPHRGPDAARLLTAPA
jgi:predicted N-formylglutamate amidohydrolase